MMMNFGDFMRMMESGGGPARESKCPLSRKEQVDILMNRLLDIESGCKFKKGDLVEVNGSDEKYAYPPPEYPAIVVRVFEPTFENYPAEPSNPVNCEDMTIAVLTGTGLRLYNVSSLYFKKYDGPRP
jgi:hypothetical protein